MSDQQAHFTIEARVRRADWPGRRAICTVFSAPKFIPDMWFLTGDETGRTDVLERYSYRAWRQR